MNEDVKFIVSEAIAEHCDIDLQKHNQLRNDFVDEMRKINEKLDAMTPTIREIEQFKSAYVITGKFVAGVVKIILGFGILWGAVYAIKEFIKK